MNNESQYKISMIIADKFNELVYKKLHSYTDAELAIWYIIILRTEKDMCGFNCIFEQALKRNEIEEAIRYLKTLSANNLARLFAGALAILDSEKAYSGGYGITDGLLFDLLSEDAYAKIQTIAKQVGNKLWKLDDALYQNLRNETVNN